MQNILVKVDERMPAEKCIRKFKRMCDTYGIAKMYKARKEYRKPSVRHKEKTEAAVKRRIKNEMKLRRRASKI